MRLTQEQVQQISLDLKTAPQVFGYSQSQWTGNCLSEHLATRYGLIYGARHCRRLIAQAGIHSEAPRARLRAANQQAKPLAFGQTLDSEPVLRGFPNRSSFTIPEPEHPSNALNNSWSGFSAIYRHEKTLTRLRRLSTANLPLKAFAASLFEQLTSATGSGEAAQALMVGSVTEQRWILRDLETVEWTLAHMSEHERANSDDPAISGMLIPFRRLPFVNDPVLAPEQFMAPRFHESPSYDEVWRHHRIHFGAFKVLREQGKLVGFAPIWKSRREKPFTHDDLRFCRKAVPMIAHGIYAGLAQSSLLLAPAETESTGAPLGIVTTDLRGRVMAIDRTARALFAQPSLFDGKPLDAFSSSNLRSGLQYVSAIVRQTFTGVESAAAGCLSVPAARVWWHATGCILMLRAVLSERASGSPLVTIFVEEREPASVKQRRLAFKYGMSPRESQISQLAAAGATRKAIARQLSLSVNTVKTYLKQIAYKTDNFV